MLSEAAERPSRSISSRAPEARATPRSSQWIALEGRICCYRGILHTPLGGPSAVLRMTAKGGRRGVVELVHDDDAVVLGVDAVEALLVQGLDAGEDVGAVHRADPKLVMLSERRSAGASRSIT